MSVPEPLRHKGRLEVHVKAQFLASYTIKILGNEKVFPPTVDKELVRRIRNCAMDIYAKAWTANKIHAEANPVNREMRFRMQEDSILLCDAMLAYIGIAKQVFHLRNKRMKYWGGIITEVQSLLQAWKESDIKRYGEP